MTTKEKLIQKLEDDKRHLFQLGCNKNSDEVIEISEMIDWVKDNPKDIES